MMVYFEFVKKKFLNNLEYKFNYIMGIISTILSFLIFICIYKALYGGAAEIDGITFSMVATNFLLSLCLSNVYKFDDEFIQHKLRDGQIANELLKPISFKGRLLAENLGENLFGVCFNFLPTLFIALFITNIEKPASVISFLLFLVSAILGYFILWEISFIIQTLSFWVFRIWGISTIKNVIIDIFSGTMIPLWFMPQWILDFIKWTPFDSIYFTPVKTYLGQVTSNQLLINFSRQIIWIIIFFIIGHILWKCGEKKVVVQGG